LRWGWGGTITAIGKKLSFVNIYSGSQLNNRR